MTKKIIKFIIGITTIRKYHELNQLNKR